MYQKDDALTDSIHNLNNASVLNQVLAERKGTHGDFTQQADLTQSLEYVVNECTKVTGAVLNATQREAIHMILHKIARAVCGNPNVEDHWRDMAGYATLVADRVAQTLANERAAAEARFASNQAQQEEKELYAQRDYINDRLSTLANRALDRSDSRNGDAKASIITDRPYPATFGAGPISTASTRLSTRSPQGNGGAVRGISGAADSRGHSGPGSGRDDCGTEAGAVELGRTGGPYPGPRQ